MAKNRKLCARFDITRATMAKGLQLGETVTITVVGKVRSLRGPEESLHTEYPPGKYGQGKGKEVKDVYPGSVELEISKFEVDGENEFDMPEDD